MSLLFANAVICAFIGSLWVQRNRGQILEMPEWKIVPQVTSIGILFALALIYCFYEISPDAPIYEKLIMFFPAMAAVSFFVIRGIVGIIRRKRNEGKGGIGDIDDGEGDTDTKESSDKQGTDDKTQYYKEQFSLIRYTIIYFCLFYDIIFLLEQICVYIARTSKVPLDFLAIWEASAGYLSMFIISEIGMIFIIVCVYENLYFQKEKSYENKIAQVKEYLEAKSTKN